MANVLLLPDFVKPLKEAARAAKETMGQVIHKVKEVTVSQLLGLPQFVVTEYRVAQRGEQAILSRPQSRGNGNNNIHLESQALFDNFPQPESPACQGQKPVEHLTGATL